jgi:hypothetical protein
LARFSADSAKPGDPSNPSTSLVAEIPEVGLGESGELNLLLQERPLDFRVGWYRQRVQFALLGQDKMPLAELRPAHPTCTLKRLDVFVSASQRKIPLAHDGPLEGQAELARSPRWHATAGPTKVKGSNVIFHANRHNPLDRIKEIDDCLLLGLALGDRPGHIDALSDEATI